MPRIIFISPHFKSGRGRATHLSYLVRYIATREGVAPVADADRLKPATEKQDRLIRQMVKDFPSAKRRFEYEDYLVRPTQENASDFIQTALEQNLDQIGKRENYVDYIGMRPSVAKLDANGLFDGTGKKLVISQVQKEIAEHPGVVWTPVISLRREDAHAMGFESPESWRAMLCSCAAELAKGYKIRPEHLRWYAAFHDKSHHPHIHMILYSTDPTEGFLTEQGITQIKSALAQNIFPEQLRELYAADTQRRDALKADARKLYQELIVQMASGTIRNERIEKLTGQLAAKLSAHKGKMQYGYLQAPVRAMVDEIVDELARDARVAEAYRLWYDIRTDIVSTYQDEMPELPLLSRQKEFKPIRNMVVTEAAKLLGHEFIFEEAPSGEQKVPEDVRKLVRIIHAPASTTDAVRDAAVMLLQIADDGNPDAAYALGKLFLQGNVIREDVPKAVRYLTAAAGGGNANAMYVLGKLYLVDEDVPQREYHISAHRTTVSDDIQVLAQAGLDVDMIKSTQNKYRVLSRTFDVAEIKLLIDAAESSKFITEKKSESLIKKLQKLASIHSANALKRNLKACSRFKPDNEEVFYIADTVNEAINAGKKIAFQYYDYNAQKEKTLKNGGQEYIFSPYYMVWDGDCYYMVGYSEKHQNIGNFRMDRIYQQPTILDEPAVPVPTDFNINDYIKTSFRMYNSKRQKVELICDNSTMDAILDRFGMDVEIHENDSASFRVVVDVAVSHVFYAWVFGFGGRVKIKAPDDVNAAYGKMVRDAVQALDSEI